MKQLNLEGISILQMQIFITAGTELNYTRTASICNVTQPTISRSIDALEKTLDLKLFYKKGSYMQLTAAGEVIHSCFKEMLCELYRNIQIAHEQQLGIGSKVRITFPVNSSLSKPISILGQEFLDHFQDKNVSIEYKDSGHAEGLQYLLQNRVDVLFTVDTIEDEAGKYEELESAVIMKMPLTAYMLRTNPLSCRRKISFSDLENQKLIVQKRETDTFCARKLESFFSKAGYVPKISRYCDFVLEGVMNIQKDDEVVIADRFALPFGLANMTRVELDMSDMKYIMMWRKNEKKDGIIHQFVDYANEYFKNASYAIFE